MQRSGGLSRIARDGHVYAFAPNPLENPAQWLSTPQLIGLQKASTIPGFCAEHDTATFRPIETQTLVPTNEQAFLLGYRALCYELHAKEGLHELLPTIREGDRGRPKPSQVATQRFADLIEYGALQSLDDLRVVKSRYDEILCSSDFSPAGFYAIETSATPDMLCAGGILPECHFQGRPLQDLASADRLDSVQFSLVATDRGCMCVFSWVDDSEPCEALARSLDLLDDSAIPHAIVRFIFEFLENTYMSPRWWDALPDAARKQIARRVVLAADPTARRSVDCLIDDGVRVVEWPITTRHRSFED